MLLWAIGSHGRFLRRHNQNHSVESYDGKARVWRGNRGGKEVVCKQHPLTQMTSDAGIGGPTAALKPGARQEDGEASIAEGVGTHKASPAGLSSCSGDGGPGARGALSRLGAELELRRSGRLLGPSQ